MESELIVKFLNSFHDHVLLSLFLLLPVEKCIVLVHHVILPALLPNTNPLDPFVQILTKSPFEQLVTEL